MAFELDANLPPALAPLAWLVGRWEGAGVLGYPTRVGAFRSGDRLLPRWPPLSGVAEPDLATG